MLFPSGDDKVSGPDTPSCRHFEIHDILSATDNFDESLVIGHGGFGKVYKGNIRDGSSSVVAAIKRLDTMSNQGAAEFWAEVETLSKLRHCNLVSLLGYCNHEKEMILVYEFMSNGTLEDHLYKLGTHLTWIQRLKICIGAGHGLHYLHTGTGIESGVIHRDVKSSNILLHESWAAKISDFGLSKIGPTNQPTTYVNTLIKGTFGYLDPDYYATGKLTRRSDVYAFGVVMLELLCRRQALDRSLDEEQMNLARWVQESIEKGNVKQIVDSDIRGEIAPKCLKEFVRTAKRCLCTNTKQRSTMAQVLVSLENVLILQEKYNNNSLQSAGRTLLGRMVNMLPFSSNGEKSVQGRSIPSSDSMGNNGRASNFIQKFEIDVLRKSTNNFSQDMIIGVGGFGITYLGWVNENTFTPTKHGDGIAVAVKKLLYCQEHAEWQAEISFIGQLAHPNIVTLLGYCSDESIQCLVFEYMPNKSLDCFIFTDIPEPLSWRTRLIYENTTHICDGITSVVSLQSIGTYGYTDRIYVNTGHLGVEGDIYSFGVVLLEVLTGIRVTDRIRPIRQQKIIEWARPILGEREELKKIMDPRLEQDYPVEGAFDCALLALRCLERYPIHRPSSEEVLQSLEQILSN